MVTGEQLAAVFVASFVLIVVPGPSVLFIVGRALAHGRRTALVSVAGNTAGSVVMAVLVAGGLGPLLQRSATLLDVVRLAGAAYLVWLGVQAWRHAGAAAGQTGADSAPPGMLRALRAGFVVAVTNPKVLLLLGAVLPHFVDPARGNVPGQLFLLALVPLSIGLVTDSLWGLAAGTARAWFSGAPRRLVVLARIGGLSMIGLGTSVAVVDS